LPRRHRRLPARPAAPPAAAPGADVGPPGPAAATVRGAPGRRRRVRPRRHDRRVRRRGGAPVGAAAGRPAAVLAGDAAAGAAGRAPLPAHRAPRPRRVPPRVRPPVRGRGRGGAARARPGPARRRAAAAGVAAGDPPDPAAPRRRAPHRPAHRHRGRVRRAAPRPLRRHARRAAPRRRRALHRALRASPAHRGGPRRVAARLGPRRGHRPDRELGVRRPLLGPPRPGGGRQPRRRPPRRPAVPARQAAALGDRGLGRRRRGGVRPPRRGPGGGPMILALEYHRSPARYLAAGRLPGRLRPAAVPSLAPLRLSHRPPPAAPGPGWVRLRTVLSGICGSDLAMAAGKVSPYLPPLVSMPFVPGHEVLAELMDDVDGMPAGTRVVLDPVLPCRARGTGPCPSCASGHENRCDHVNAGRISSGLQTGFCADTGGGWSERLVAHRTQLHRVPESLPPERAVLAEPLACAVRSVRRIDVPRGTSTVVVGAGTVGLLTVLALRELTPAGPITVIARHAGQRRRARALGATETIDPSAALRGLRRITGGSLVRPELGPGYLLGGADIVVECTG